MFKTFKLALAAVFICAAVSAQAGWEDDFKKYLSHEGIKGFTKDLGYVVGMTDNNGGSVTSFPGFNVGITANAVKADNKIADAADFDYMGLPFLYADAKLPLLGFSVAARGTAGTGVDSLGGGIIYKLAGDNIIPFFPDITAAGYYDRLDSDNFDADHYSVSLKASLQVLILEPYLAYGYDYTDLKVKKTGTAFDGSSYTADGGRLTLGLSVHPFPFVYIFGAGTKTSKDWGGQLGLGVNF
ncbi:hypothetical protein Dip518_001179 [Parelusimicrobium proximum]|uniref:hypothetical protein n=1 Tax=Parelusimicrobium proximum TaxID=3228953 RepID=UPI003D185F04